MIRQSIAATAMLSALLLGGTASAGTAIVQFRGTADQLRLVCVGSGLTISVLPGETSCVDEMRGNGVSCGEEGDCVAIDPRRAASSYRSRFSPPPSGPGLVTRS